MIKLLHTRLRVSNLPRSISFYERLGFQCVKRIPKSPEGNELAFLELSGNEHQLELTFTPGKDVVVPEDMVHTALGFPDLTALCASLESEGIPIWPDNWREKFKHEKMAFVTDPDGYEVELLERSPLEDLDIELPEEEEDKEEKKEDKAEKKTNISAQNVVIVFVAGLAGFAAGQVIGQYLCTPLSTPISIIKSMEPQPTRTIVTPKQQIQPKVGTPTALPQASSLSSATSSSAAPAAATSTGSSADGTF